LHPRRPSSSGGSVQLPLGPEPVLDSGRGKCRKCRNARDRANCSSNTRPKLNLIEIVRAASLYHPVALTASTSTEGGSFLPAALARGLKETGVGNDRTASAARRKLSGKMDIAAALGPRRSDNGPSSSRSVLPGAGKAVVRKPAGSGNSADKTLDAPPLQPREDSRRQSIGPPSR